MVMVVAVIEELIVIRDTKGSRRRNSWILAPPLRVGKRTWVASTGGEWLEAGGLNMLEVSIGGVPK